MSVLLRWRRALTIWRLGRAIRILETMQGSSATPPALPVTDYVRMQQAIMVLRCARHAARRAGGAA